jgi:hypothetical protein
MGKTCSTHIGEMANPHRMLVGISDERLIGRHKSRREGNIQTDISEIGPEDVGGICLTEQVTL